MIKSHTQDQFPGSQLTLTCISDGSEEICRKAPKERASWGNQMEFLLTCVGYAVGLGNLWRFPYLCYRNGGGAFLVPYFIMLVSVGLPLFYLELAFGQFASLGPITIWKINGLFKGVGWATVLVNFGIGLYYNVIIAYCIFYLFASMSSQLPWDSCDNAWNSPLCRIGNASLLNASGFSINASVTSSPALVKSPTEEYFYNRVLGLSSGIEDPGYVKWELALCLLAAWTVVFLVLIKGIKSLGKVVYFSALFPYVLLTVLLVRGVTLDGSMDGIRYYLTPQWHRLADSRVWSDAAVQIFYSLSCCSGGLVAMSSFSKFTHNCRRDALLVPFINCGTSVFAGFVIFSMLGFMAKAKGVDVSEVADGGPGLAFIVYPEGISKMPVAPLWSILFFLMMLTLGFSSQFSIMETVITGVADEFKKQLRDTFRKATAFRAVVIVLGYILGLPMCLQSGMYLLNLLDVNLGGFPLLIVGLLELMAISWVYGFERFSDDIQMMLGDKPGIYWRVTWCYLSPVILLSTIVFLACQQEPMRMGGYFYPDFAVIIGWVVAMAPMVLILVWACVWYCRHGGVKLCYAVSRPLPSWGPAQDENRTGIYAISHVTSFPTNKREDTTKQHSQSALAFTNQAYKEASDDVIKTCDDVTSGGRYIDEAF